MLNYNFRLFSLLLSRQYLKIVTVIFLKFLLFLFFFLLFCTFAQLHENKLFE